MTDFLVLNLPFYEKTIRINNGFNTAAPFSFWWKWGWGEMGSYILSKAKCYVLNFLFIKT